MSTKMKYCTTLAMGMSLLLMVLAAPVSSVRAQEAGDPAQLVDLYLASLASGDTQTLSGLIDGRMKTKNRALELDPDSYGVFLQNHYNGVETTVEDIVSGTDRIVARVRFDYPTSDSAVIEFILTPVAGQWKITDENY